MNDEEYVGIHLNKIIPDQNLPEDIFVFLNDHYVKLVSKGDPPLSREKGSISQEGPEVSFY